MKSFIFSIFFFPLFIFFSNVPVALGAISVYVSPDRQSLGITCDSPSDISGVPYISMQDDGSGTDISEWNTAYDNGTSLTGLCDPIVYFYGASALDPTFPTGSAFTNVNSLNGFDAYEVLMDIPLDLKVGSVIGDFYVCSNDGLFSLDGSECSAPAPESTDTATSTIEQVQTNIFYLLIIFCIGLYWGLYLTGGKK